MVAKYIDKREQKGMKNVLIGGVLYGLNNIGDEAILLSMLNSFSQSAHLSVESCGSRWIRGEYPSVDILPIRAMYAQPRLGLYATPRHRIIHTIKNSFFPNLSNFEGKDLFICGGATILSDCPWHSLRLVELAGKRGVASVLWGVGMARVLDSKTLAYIRKVCNSPKVRAIFTRDEYVGKRLEDLGVTRSKIFTVYDPAIMLIPEDFEPEAYLDANTIRLLDDGKKHICISLSGEADVTDRQHIYAVRQYIEIVTHDIGADVFLVPTGCGKHCSDRAFLKSLATNNRVAYIDREFAPRHLIRFLQDMDLIVSSRLHCNILGAAATVPSIALVRNQKLTDFAALFGFPFFYLNRVQGDDLLEATKMLLGNMTRIRQQIEKQVAHMRTVHEVGVKQMVDQYLR